MNVQADMGFGTSTRVFEPESSPTEVPESPPEKNQVIVSTKIDLPDGSSVERLSLDMQRSLTDALRLSLTFE